VLRLLDRLGERVVVITTETPPGWPHGEAEERARLITGDAREA
jgi:hypothetical protein